MYNNNYVGSFYSPTAHQAPGNPSATAGATAGPGVASDALAGMSMLGVAFQAFGSYMTAAAGKKIANINREANNFIALQAFRVNQHIAGLNSAALYAKSSDEKLRLEVGAMEATATAEVNAAANGVRGGSVQSVLNNILQNAERANSARIADLDSDLRANQLQLYGASTARIAATNNIRVESENALQHSLLGLQTALNIGVRGNSI